MSGELFDRYGRRKYLNADERSLFLKALENQDQHTISFCSTLYYGGCRISEALNLTANRVDLANHMLVFESLKKRKRGIYRAVPVPPSLLDILDRVHDLRAVQNTSDGGRTTRLWSWSRTTAWRKVNTVMRESGIGHGPHAAPKGLRHGFGVTAVGVGIPLNLVQRWLGHAQLSTTAIYADAVGAEEKDIASRMWPAESGGSM